MTVTFIKAINNYFRASGFRERVELKCVCTVIRSTVCIRGKSRSCSLTVIRASFAARVAKILAVGGDFFDECTYESMFFIKTQKYCHIFESYLPTNDFFL